MKISIIRTITTLFLIFIVTLLNAQQVTLNITNPAAVCSPQTIDITAPSITTGSIGDGTLSYWTDTNATKSLTTPSAITSSGTYYIKSINGSYSDIKPVIVVINVAPSITNPGNKSVCDSYTLPTITGTNLSGNQKYYNNTQANGGTQILDPLTATQTVWIYDIQGSCSDEKSFIITINQTPSITNPGPQTVCGSYTLPVITGTNLSGTQKYFNAPQSQYCEVLKLPITTTQTVWIYDKKGTCKDEKSFLVTVTPVPTFTTPSNQTVCHEYKLPVITGTNLTGNQKYYNNSQALGGTQISGLLTTSQTVWIYDTKGVCSSEKSFVVTINNCATIKNLNSSDFDTNKVCLSNSISEIKYYTTIATGATVTGLPEGTLSEWKSDTLKISGVPTTVGNYTYTITLTGGTGNTPTQGYINVYSCNSATLLITPIGNVVCSSATFDITNPSITANSPKGIVLSYWKDAGATIPLDSANAISKPGSYYIKSVNGSDSDIKGVYVFKQSPINLTITNPAAVCSPTTVDITDPSITYGSSAGGTYSYWSDLACTSPIATPDKITTSGTYYIKLIIGNCFDVKPVVVSVISNSPTLTVTNPSTICSPNSVNLGVPSITAGSTSGGVLSYWTDASATSYLKDPYNITTSGTYYIKLSIGNCFDIKPVVVTLSLNGPSLTVTNPSIVCSPNTIDITNLSITAGSTGGGVLSYWTDASATSVLSNPNNISTSGVYYIKSMSGNCFDIKPVNVIINSCNSIVLISEKGSDNQIVCKYNPIKDIKYVTHLMTGVTFSGLPSGVTGSWKNDTITISGSISPPTINFGANNYSINSVGANTPSSVTGIITIESCSSPISLKITNPPAVCSPETIDITSSSITYGSSVGNSLTYWTDASATKQLTSPSAISVSGTYYIKLENNSYSDIKPVTVEINNCNTIKLISPWATNNGGKATCVNTSMSPIKYVTTEATGAELIPLISTESLPKGIQGVWVQDTMIVSGILTEVGQFRYKINTIGGVGSASAEGALSVINCTAATLNILDPNEVCSPATVDITASSITTGSASTITSLTYWTDAAATIPLTNPSSISVTGTYYIKSTGGTDTDIKPVNVVVNTSPNLVITNPQAVTSPTTVDLTSVTITAGSIGNGKLTYWTDAIGNSELINPSAVSSSGTYYIKSSLDNCFTIKPVIVEVNTKPIFYVNNKVRECLPNTVDITKPNITLIQTVGGTFSYWIDEACTNPLINPTSIASSGTYFIKYNIGNSFDVKPVIIEFSTPKLVIKNPAPVCSPNMVNIKSGALDETIVIDGFNKNSRFDGGLSYWTDLACTTPITNSDIYESGTYYYKYTIGQCSDIKPVDIIVNTTPILTIQNPLAICSPNTVDLTSSKITEGSKGNGKLSYWTDEKATVELTNPSAVASSGIYYIKSYTGEQCFDIKPVVVTTIVSPKINLTEQKVTAQGQCDGAIQATVSGVSSYKFNWYHNSDSTNLNQTGLCAGVYKFSVKSNEGCVKDTVGKVGITAPTNPCVNSTLMVSTSTIQLTGATSNDGKIISTVSGGVAPYSYHWNNGSTATFIELLKPDTYRLIVTDAQGCSGISTGIIANYVAPNVTVPLKAYVISSGETASSSCDGSASVIVSGGAQPYTYIHSNGTTNSSISYLCQGLYNVKVIDANKDTVNVNYIITSPSNTIVNKPIAGSIQPVDSCYASLIKNCTIDIDHIDSAYIVGFSMIGKDSVSVEWKVVDSKGVVNVLTNKYSLPDSAGVFQFSLQLYCPTKSEARFLIAYDQLKITQELVGGSSSAGLNKIDINKVEIYPNPFSDHIIIAIDNNESSEVLITDIAGKVVVNRKFNDKLIKIDMNELSSGSYIVTVRNNNIIRTKQIVK